MVLGQCSLNQCSQRNFRKSSLSALVERPIIFQRVLPFEAYFKQYPLVLCFCWPKKSAMQGPNQNHLKHPVVASFCDRIGCYSICTSNSSIFDNILDVFLEFPGFHYFLIQPGNLFWTYIYYKIIKHIFTLLYESQYNDE